MRYVTPVLTRTYINTVLDCSTTVARESMKKKKSREPSKTISTDTVFTILYIIPRRSQDSDGIL